MRKRIPFITAAIILLSFIFTSCSDFTESFVFTNNPISSVSLEEIPEFSNSPYVIINNNMPNFDESDFSSNSFETYGNLDNLGRCTGAFANIGIDLMPTEERGSISQVKPSGWHTVKYDIVDGKYLYNRCHLIGFQLTGENANEENLITGTRFLNVEGMLPFENMTADYIKETENHVLYRVTPIFEEDNLVANGVHLEAISVEDNGEGICFNVYIYNNQPGIEIDYLTGESFLLPSDKNQEDDSYYESYDETYILNTNTLKFHYPSCSSVSDLDSKNKDEFTGNRNILIDQGYSPCGKCKP